MAGLRGRAFGGYELIEQLPSGGIADVYRGRPIKSGGRDVVVKVIYPEFAHQLGFIPHFREIVATFGKLANHPHILPLLASGEDSGYLYLVTPYVEAGTLRDWLRKGNRMGAGDAAPFFRQMCDALSYAHSLSIVHGNLKPSNIFLFEGRHVLVGDFGLLWDVSHMDMNHAGSGTEAVEFLAPEVFSGNITQLSDIYSLGALLFAALVGHAPFHGTKLADILTAAAHQPIPRLAQANPALPPPAQAFDAVIQKAMARRPEDRFPSAAAVAQAIETTAHQAQMAAPAFAAGAAPFAPMSAPMPAGTPPVPPMPIQSGPVGMQAMSGQILPGAATPFGAPALSLAQAAAAMGGTAASLGQLDPPFPPLPPTAQPEAQMEQARPGGVGGATDMRAALHAPTANPPGSHSFSESTVQFPAPPAANIPPQPTMHVPAPVAPDIPGQTTMQVPAPPPAAPPMSGSASPGRSAGLNAGQPWGDAGNAPPPGLGAPLEPRPMRLSGAPRARLGLRHGAPFPTLEDEEEDFGPPALPVVRPPVGQGGFAVAGGTGSFDPGARGMSPPRNDAYSSENLSGGAALDARMPDAGSFSGYDNSPYDDHGAAHEPRDFASDMLSGAHEEHPGYSDSADQRWGMEPPPTGEYEAHGGWNGGYTSEQMGYGNEPAGWQGAPLWGENAGQHLASYGGDYTSEQSAPRYSGGMDGGHPDGGGSDGRPFSATQLGLPRLTSPVLMEQPPSWQEILADAARPPSSALMSGELAPNGVGERAPTWEDAGESMWQPAVQAPAPRIPPHVEAEWTGAAGAWGTSAVPAAPADKNKKASRRSRPEEDNDSGFDDDRVWTVGTTAIRPRRRWPRKLMLLLLVILLIDMGALLVLRPDLCPTSGCRSLSATLRHQLGLTQSTSTPAPLTFTPNPVTLTVQSGKSNTARFSVKNVTGSNVTWKASTDLSWLTIDPATGSFAVNGGTDLTLTAKPSSSVKAGTYTTNVTISLTGTTAQAVTIPVTVTVTAGS